MAPAARARLAPEQLIGAAVNVAEGVGAVALAFLGGLLVWTLLAPESAAPAPGRVPVQPALSPARLMIDRSVLWREDLFGGAAGGAVEETAPETTLNLTLFGVAAGVGDTPGVAIIRTPDNRQNAFREGAAIIAGVTLQRVLPDRVVISRDGAPETLFFPNARRPQADARSAAAPGPSSPAAALSPDALYGAMEVELATRNGAPVGLRIARALDPALLARAGLAEGDIVLEIAGRPLADVSSVADLFESLRGAASAEMVVDRGGAQIPLTLTFGTPQ